MPKRKLDSQISSEVKYTLNFLHSIRSLFTNQSFFGNDKTFERMDEVVNLSQLKRKERDIMQTWEEIVERLRNPLPGATAQWKMAPVGRARVPLEDSILEGYRESAVLVPFIQRETGWHLVLTLRSTYDGVHSAQVSFPGGKFEEGEDLPEQVAVREAGEELGILPHEIEIAGRLSPITIPVSKMRVQPVIAKLSRTIPFLPDPREVSEVLEVPFNFLTDRMNLKTVEVRAGKDQKMEVPAFDLGKSVIWGATAMMISELLVLLNPDY